MPCLGERARQFFVPYNGKIADITHADTNKHTLDLAAALTETRKIIAVLVCASRIAGTGDFFTYPNEGTFSAFTGADTRPNCIVIADGTQRLQYSLGVASSDWDLYCKGYVVEAYSLPATITCYWSAEC